jgi:hypothetical protein
MSFLLALLADAAGAVSDGPAGSPATAGTAGPAEDPARTLSRGAADTVFRANVADAANALMAAIPAPVWRQSRPSAVHLWMDSFFLCLSF